MPRKNYPVLWLLYVSIYAMTSCNKPTNYWLETQLTFTDQNHELDHNDNFSPDDQWIVYDTRPNPAGIAQNSKIEKVHIASLKQEVIYQLAEATPYGPGVGAVSYHPFLYKVAFIHGLEPATEKMPYAAHRRTGVIFDERAPASLHFMDSRDVFPPFTTGALRGGTHRHQWSADGDWIGFTYNDAVMVDLEAKTGQKHDLRTVGVSKRIGPKVTVKPDSIGENIQGEWFSAVVVSVVADPKPGSDEISKAYEDWWVGTKGYRQPDGSLQRARAFIGDLVSAEGNPLSEVFVVDIPEDIHVPGHSGPLEGTLTSMPAPPLGARVVRITHTADKRYPGVSPSPRHWLSSSSDGSYISFLAKDDAGVVQVFLVSPLGGDPIPATTHESDVQSMVRWHPELPRFAYVCDNSLFLAEVSAAGKVSAPVRITEKHPDAPFAPCWSRKGDMIAFNRYVGDGANRYIQVFLSRP